MIAATRDMTTVRMIVLTPDDIPLNAGIREAAVLSTKHEITVTAIVRLCTAGGTMIAINIPNSATLSAETANGGITSPTMTPRAVPTDHPGSATDIAP